MKCKNCNKEIGDNVLFCRFCGQEVEVGSAESESAEPAASSEATVTAESNTENTDVSEEKAEDNGNGETIAQTAGEELSANTVPITTESVPEPTESKPKKKLSGKKIAAIAGISAVLLGGIAWRYCNRWCAGLQLLYG